MSLVCWLPLDGNSTNHGTGHNKMTGSPGSWTGISAKFAGSTGTVIYDNSAANLYFRDNFTYCAWIKQNYTGTAAQWAFTVGRADYSTFGYGIATASTSQVRTWFGNGSMAVSCPANEWHHIAVSAKGKKATVYLDGKQAGEFSSAAQYPSYSDADASGLGVGAFHYSGGNNIYPYYGEIRDLRIYDEPLGPKEIKEISKGLILHYRLTNAKGGGNKNYFNANSGLSNYYSGTVTKDGNQYKIVSPAGSNVWGNGFSFVGGQLSVPPNTWYTISFDALVPTSHSINVDINNSMEGSTSNDNDQRARLVRRNWNNIPANTWTKVSWSGYGNASKTIGVYDGVGLLTTNDSESTTWYVRNIQMELNDEPSDYSLPNDFPSSNKIPDSSGYLNHGIVTGTLDNSSDTPRYSSSTSSTQDTVAGKGNHYILASTGFGKLDQFTITGWVNQSSGGGYSTIMSNSRNLGACGLWLAVNTESNGLWGYDGIYLRYPTLLDHNKWYHFAFVFNKGKVKFYCNGDSSDEVDWTTKETSVDLSNIYIFDSYPSTGWDTHFVGKLSDIRLYSSILSQDDIKSMISNVASVTQDGKLMTRGEVVE